MYSAVQTRFPFSWREPGSSVCSVVYFVALHRSCSLRDCCLCYCLVYFQQGIIHSLCVNSHTSPLLVTESKGWEWRGGGCFCTCFQRDLCSGVVCSGVEPCMIELLHHNHHHHNLYHQRRKLNPVKLTVVLKDGSGDSETCLERWCWWLFPCLQEF